MSSSIHECGGLDLADAVRALYNEGQTDYSMEPVVLADLQGSPIGRVHDGDAVVFCCRRGEREIQLTEAFTEVAFEHFPRPHFHNLPFVILTLYHEKFKDLPVAFAPVKVQGTLAEAISRAGLRQAHIAESEKFAHVTFFFNGGNNQPFPMEDDFRVPSPKGIPHEQIPELSLPAVVEQVLKATGQGYDFIVVNFANGDVIGHTSNPQAKIQCAEIIDRHLDRVVKSALGQDYVVFITADHGNLEELYTPEGTPHVSHTSNPVPLVVIDPHNPDSISLSSGKLSELAPTILMALGVNPTPAMSPNRLVTDHTWGEQRKVLLIILDGWGIGMQSDSNPIFLAQTPTWDDLLVCYPHTQLEAAGEAVGLKPGKAGNSEAGHINIGSGRVVLQDDVRLDQAMRDGTFASNEVLCETLNGVQERQTSLHLIGLLTEKSSHGSIDYPLAILRMAKVQGLSKVYLHMILDGRSTEPGSAPALLEKLDYMVASIGPGQIVSCMGRGIALDRDGNYSKTQRAYDALVSGTGKLWPWNPCSR